METNVDNMLGARLVWEDRCNYREGIVYKVNNDKRGLMLIGAGGLTPITVTVDVVWHDGLVTKGIDMNRFDLLPGVATPEEIEKALADAQAERAKKEAETKAKAEEDARLRDALPLMYPHLVTAKSKPNLHSARVAAENIRKLIKKAFPLVKFSVTSDYNSIDIRWTDGPTSDSVNAIVGKFKRGHFDGMSDSYDYSKDRTFTDTFGGACYVFAQRGETTEGIRRAWQLAGNDPSEITEKWYDLPNRRGEEVRRVWSATAL